MMRRWATDAGHRWEKWGHPLAVAQPLWSTRLLFWVACLEVGGALSFVAARYADLNARGGLAGLPLGLVFIALAFATYATFSHAARHGA